MKRTIDSAHRETVADAILRLAGLRQEIAQLQKAERTLCASLRTLAEERGGEIVPANCPLRGMLVERDRPRWKAIAAKLAVIAWGAKWRKPLGEMVKANSTESLAFTLRPNYKIGRKAPGKVVSIAPASKRRETR